jgi:lysophospholipase
VRLFFAFLTVLTLAACSRGDEGGVLIDSRTPPALAPRFFPPDNWGFGVIALPKTPHIRYGAAAPDGPPRANVVILPAYGESAEVYYETVRELTAKGYAVWVLDGVAQGGSARFPGPRDLGRSNGFGFDAAALEGLVKQVVRPDAGRPLVVAASGSSALSALLAAEDGRSLVDGMFLWDPALAAAPGADRAARMTHWRLGGLRAEGGSEWGRPTGDLSGRATLPAAWQLANPDLRMGGPAWEWIAAEDSTLKRLLGPGQQPGAPRPIEIVSASNKAALLCSAFPKCHVQGAAASALPRHLAPDPVRNPWRDALIAFIEARIAERAHAA